MADQTAIRQMCAADIPVAMRLKNIARWNQIPADWEGFMELEPEGCLVYEVGDQVVGTATAFDYENRFGWIGMILVDPDFRRRGIATRLMERTIENLESLPCPCQKLDATDMGARVYERIGFQVEYAVERWRRPADSLSTRLSQDVRDVRQLDSTVVDLISAWDKRSFGSSRKRLLRWYCSNGYPGLLAGDPLSPEGFIIGRPGSNAFHVGPFVAADPDVAGQLLQKYLSPLEGQHLITDIVVPNQAAQEIFRACGFQRHRELLRMYRGPNDFPGKPDQVFSLAGFEFG
jgi:GNAT superfamily N-acetyltransferase